VSLLGRFADEGGVYAGCAVESCCDLSCTDEGCNPPVGLLVCQTAYSAEARNAVLVTWQSGDTDYAGIDVLIGGQPVGTAPPVFDTVIIGGFTPGPWNLGVRGNCAAAGSSASATQDFTVRASSPHASPIEGTPDCVLDEATASAAVSWTIRDPSAFTLVWVDREPQNPNAGFGLESVLGGHAQAVQVENVGEDARIQLQFFAFRDGGCYGSQPVECQPAPPPPPVVGVFVRGVCDGAGQSPQISSAIFGLNHLFRGGAAPPCREACDTNADGRFNLTDAVLVLNFLFLAGPPPRNWADSNGDGVADPVCEPLAEGALCETPSGACVAE
jgi:hypothetical protein